MRLLKEEEKVSNIKANNYLINLDWEKDLFFNMDDEYDEELAGKRMVFLFKSMRQILINNGKQIMSGESEVDYPVKGLINQILRMRGQDKISDIEIAKLKAQGYKSAQIAQMFTNRGMKISESGIRKRDGWSNYVKYLQGTDFVQKIN